MNEVQELEFENPFDADKFILKHCCSACWGILIKKVLRREDGTRFYKAECELCGDKLYGYVSKNWVQIRIRENKSEAVIAKHALAEAIPWMKIEKLSEEEILKRLGF